MDCKEHSHVALSIGNKNPQVLKEDRELNEENGETVNDRIVIDNLTCSQLSMLKIWNLDSNKK